MSKLNFERAVYVYIAFLNYLQRLTLSLRRENKKLADRWSKVSLKSDPAEVNELKAEIKGLSGGVMSTLIFTVSNYKNLVDYVKSGVDKDEYLAQLIIFYKTGRDKELDAALEMLEGILGSAGMKKIMEDFFSAGDFVRSSIAQKIKALLY